MLTLLFTILMIMVFGKILMFSIRAAWGLTKILFSVVLLPIFLIGLVLTGLLTVAFPILIFIGIASLFLYD
ncbi:MAG: hypothetical protein II251_00465 [Lachnospiraceae bacterium]|nr:hypothetical protein [Lachnospiraceae bacterium]